MIYRSGILQSGNGRSVQRCPRSSDFFLAIGGERNGKVTCAPSRPNRRRLVIPARSFDHVLPPLRDRASPSQRGVILGELLIREREASLRIQVVLVALVENLGILKSLLEAFSGGIEIPHIEPEFTDL